MPQDATGAHWAEHAARWAEHAPIPALADQVFARQLRAIRQAAGLTQQQLADRVSEAGARMHRSGIAKIEAGDRVVSVGEALQLAAALGTGLADLVTDPSPGHRERAEALAQLRAAEHEAGQLRRRADEARALYEDAQRRAGEARQRLAELGDEDR